MRRLLIWKRKFFSAESGVIAPVSIASNTVYVGSTDGNLYALAAGDGTVRWKYKVDGNIYSAAAIDEDHVYFNSVKGSLYAVK